MYVVKGSAKLIKRLFVLLFITSILIGCTNNNELNQEGELEIVASELQIPWSINKLHDVFYISERGGTIAKIEDGRVTRQKVNLSESLSKVSEAGLLGFVLAPNFETSQTGYAYYTYDYNGEPTNRIVSLKHDAESWTEQTILVDYIPSGAVHHGGRLKFGPDGLLYATTGDAANRDLAQEENSLAGKILRLHEDGTIPADNPNPTSYIYSLGHRNPQGLTWAEDGTLYATEHGNSANDEVNIIEANANYGWPLIQGKEEKIGYKTPLFTSGPDTTWAPSGVVYHENMLYVAALRGEALLVFDLKTNKVNKLVSNVGRIRDVWLEENSLYFVTNNTDGRGNPSQKDDQLYKLTLK